MTVRPARAQDAGAIHALHASCVRDAFAGLLGDHLPPEGERTDRERSWTGPIGSPHPRHALLVAEHGERIVGFAAVGPTRDSDVDGHTTGELRALMVEAATRGGGAGSALIAAGERGMRDSALAVGTLWVVDANAQAIGFYERRGWHPDGSERTGGFGGHEIRSLRYRKQLMS